MAYVPIWKHRELTQAAALRAAARCSMVLYGATALNLYLESPFRFETRDLDFFLAANGLEEFYTKVTEFKAAMQDALDKLGAKQMVVTDRPMAFVSGRPATVKMFVGTVHVADVTMHSHAQIAAVEARFKRESVDVVTDALEPFTLRVASLNELLHRMAATVRGLPCVDGFYMDVSAEDPAVQDMQRARVHKDCLRLDRIMYAHGMNQKHVQWRPSPLIASCATLKCAAYELRTPLRVDADIAFPDIPAVEAMFVYVKQADARQLQADACMLRAQVDALREELAVFRRAVQVDAEQITGATRMAFDIAVRKTVADADAAVQRQRLCDAQAQQVKALRTEVGTLKQREDTLAAKLESARTKHDAKLREAMKRAVDGEKALRKTHADALVDVKARLHTLEQVCTAKASIIEDRGLYITAFEEFVKRMLQDTPDNFEMIKMVQNAAVCTLRA